MINFSELVRVRVSHKVPVVAAGMAAALSRRSDFDVHLDDDDHGPVDVVVADYATALQLAFDRTRMGGEQRKHQARVLIVADSDRESEVRAALQAGIHGYVLLNCALEELIASVVALSRGARYLCASVANRMADSMAHDSLTQRESDVLLLMVKGFSNKVIARELDIAPGTVKAHAKAVFCKLQVGTRLQAVAMAAERGLVSRPSSHPSRGATSDSRETNTVETPAPESRRGDALADALAVVGVHRLAANS